MSTDQINNQNIPKHIAIIMDGNGRWAKRQGIKRVFGHQNAVSSVRDAVEGCVELGVQYLTLYAFSTENWSRPRSEVDSLMTLLVKTVSSELDNFQKNGIKLSTIGDISKLPKSAQESLASGIEKTKTNDKINLVLALNYSGKWDILNAVNQIIEKESSPLDEEVFESYLSTRAYPDPELLVRTSGEMRISNFLLWQIAYSELYFTDTLWPDFRKKHLFEAVEAYQKRERRFGKTSEQIEKENS